MVKKLGLKREDISSNCFVDFYSIGHILFGFVCFLVCYIITTLWEILPAIEYALIMTIMTGVFWELFENTVLCHTTLKFGNKKDAVENSITDIIFVFVGGVVGSVLAHVSLDALIVGAIFFIINIYIAYELFKKVTKLLNDNGK